MYILASLVRKLYYDDNERTFGDGFYPQMIRSSDTNNTNKSIKYAMITFNLIQEDGIYMWLQANNSVIYGFEGQHGIQLLVSLNSEAKVNAKRIINCGGRIIYPLIENTTFRLLNTNYKSSAYIII